MNKTLLEVKNLKLYFRTSKGPVQAVDDVSFKLNRGKTLAVVGESGCGKTSLAKAVLRLLPRNIMVYSGEIILDGEDIMQYNEEQFRRDIRWKKIAMVPQAAMNSLNPVLRIVDQIIEPLLIHDRDMIKDKALARVKEMFKIVGLPEDFLYRYPFELSGGMRQRATIAMALATNPELVILDEPSSALDLLTQANLMNVLKRIKHDFGTTFILITHDIGTASELADEIAVMYAGEMVEKCHAEYFYTDARHPYSRKLMSSVPTLREDKELVFIPGQPPSLVNPPIGCRFAERCEQRFAKCSEHPPTFDLEHDQQVQCWLYTAGEEVKHA
ncbi:MAG: ABC transporter ATP-binding protein [Firmicutes bacterium]|jgi:oligopeptide/dipeptide ABC transporter ATP-binding protein|nr:ABC transporter ATP-binding protein [Bacillota bacterium]NLL88225.1 ABC transporter ATP-binding protein [Bacillota bacterium]